MAIGRHSPDRVEHGRFGIGQRAKHEVGPRPKHSLRSVQSGRQQYRDSHDKDECGNEMAATHRTPKDPEDHLVGQAETKYVKRDIEHDQRQTPRPVSLPARQVAGSVKGAADVSTAACGQRSRFHLYVPA